MCCWKCGRLLWPPGSPSDRSESSDFSRFCFCLASESMLLLSLDFSNCIKRNMTIVGRRPDRTFYTFSVFWNFERPHMPATKGNWDSRWLIVMWVHIIPSETQSLGVLEELLITEHAAFACVTHIISTAVVIMFDSVVEGWFWYSRWTDLTVFVHCMQWEDQPHTHLSWGKVLRENWLKLSWAS